MLLYIVKGFGVLVWLVRGGDGLDPEGGASFEFGQVAGAAFDLADAAGVAPRASPICCWVMPCVTRSSRSRRPRSAGGSPMGVAPVRMEMRAR